MNNGIQVQKCVVTQGPGEDEKNHVDIDIKVKEFSNSSQTLDFSTDVCKDILSQVSIKSVPAAVTTTKGGINLDNCKGKGSFREQRL